jgi:hypothetical protein
MENIWEWVTRMCLCLLLLFRFEFTVDLTLTKLLRYSKSLSELVIILSYIDLSEK